MPDALRHYKKEVTGSGYWMSSLLDALRRYPNLEITVATAVAKQKEHDFILDGVRYIAFDVANADRQAPARAGAVYKKKITPILQDVQPDLVHLHGTERPYGMLLDENGLFMGVLSVLSIQGIIKYVRANSWGGLPLKTIIGLHSLKGLLLFQGPIPSWWKFKRKEMMEHIMLQNASNVMGRTTWDREVVTGLNPTVRYFHVEEMMRPVFFRYKWSIEACQPYSIIATSCRTPLRGTHELLKAISLLRDEYPEIKLRLAGSISKKSGYGKYLQRLIKQYEIQSHVEFVGYLNEAALVSELIQSNLFVTASHNENSPNSLCEAQLLGVPCVATEVGGIPSLIRHEKDGMLVPPGDPAAMAGQIDRLFTHKELMEKISTEGRKVALMRHDSVMILDRLESVYNEIRGNQAKS